MNSSVSNTVVVTEDCNRTTIAILARLDHSDAPELLEAARMAIARGCAVRVDCRGASFLAAAAVQILIALQSSCRSRGVAFALEGVEPSFAAYLELAGLSDKLLKH